MKILLTGHMSFNLMAQFYGLLRDELPDAQIALYGLNRPGRSLNPEDYQLFDEVIMPPVIVPETIRKGIFGFKWLTLLTKGDLWFCIKQLLRFRLKQVYARLYSILEEQEKEQQILDKFAPFDIVNIHYLSPGYLKQTKYVQAHQKLALSFWGSDLFQETGKATYGTQLDALNKAQAVSLHTPEMEQIFLSKFGRHLKGKVHKTIFGCHEDRFNLVAKLQQETQKLKDFRGKYKIPTDKLIIQVGYSGGAGHYHFDIIDSLMEFSEILKDKVFLLVPTTYNNQDTEYFEKLKTKLENSIFEVAHLTEYLSDEEVLMLPIVSDVHINVRDADALNNAMMEALYSGNLLITGAWLPYGVLKRRNIAFAEVESITEIGALIKAYCEDRNEIYQLTKNPELTKEAFSMQNHIVNWGNMYKELYQL
jgi:hypothetical protein